MGIRRMRRLVREDRYEFSIHALEEMDEDNIAEFDVHYVLLHGKIAATLTDDPRGDRFVVRCHLSNPGYTVDVVCRFLQSGMLRIITVYRVLEE